MSEVHKRSTFQHNGTTVEVEYDIRGDVISERVNGKLMYDRRSAAAAEAEENYDSRTNMSAQVDVDPAAIVEADEREAELRNRETSDSRVVSREGADYETAIRAEHNVGPTGQIEGDDKRDSTASAPVTGPMMGQILEEFNTNSDQKRGSSRVFSSSTPGLGTIAESDREKLLQDVQEAYSQILDNIGLNFRDPLEAYGKYFNKRGETLGLDPPKTGMQYIFFTRPDLNLLRTHKDVALSPFFEYMLGTKIGNFVAEYLQYPRFRYDPNVSAHDSYYGGAMNPERTANNGAADRVVLEEAYRSQSVFDPLKSNTCITLNGGKDISIESFTGYENFTGQKVSWAKGYVGFDSDLELTVTHEDTTGSPVFLNNFLHVQYIHEVARGTMRPKYKYIWQRVLDYTISIYVFKMAEDNETIIRWAKYTGCYPYTVSLNSINDFKREIDDDAYKTVTTQYKCNFVEVMDPRIFIDFNMLTAPLALRMLNQGENIFRGDEGLMDAARRLGMIPNNMAGDRGIFRLRDSKEPAKLLERIGQVASRKEKVFSETPYIHGNKLIFI